MSATLKIKTGLIKRLKVVRDIPSDEHFARLVGVERSTLSRIEKGGVPSGAFMAQFCVAFGLGLGEAFEIDREPAIQAMDAA
ncbi:helix-turn-helix transcriptional regulator [Cryobacterium sp. PH31-AA6]|uniref:helix-turn-helix transcriptional regulator n=1 Tax=Cryobacterium sp. PH31-AA6 TaxID=3046205 RepID=UPI0024BBB80C|nr:helix-turn-helix transcriptional regulator [Cryobacterium sp. PH31-AA6]MDJ0323207.1 helix-turn-helix transcriptional regulator [Cryobacterium sp. PH31-AA6]